MIPSTEQQPQLTPAEERGVVLGLEELLILRPEVLKLREAVASSTDSSRAKDEQIAALRLIIQLKDDIIAEKDKVIVAKEQTVTAYKELAAIRLEQATRADSRADKAEAEAERAENRFIFGTLGGVIMGAIAGALVALW